MFYMFSFNIFRVFVSFSDKRRGIARIECAGSEMGEDLLGPQIFEYHACIFAFSC